MKEKRRFGHAHLAARGSRALLVASTLALGPACAGAGSLDPGSAGDGVEPTTSNTRFGLHVIWLEGEGEGNAAALDTFVDYLVGQTNLPDYWGGAAVIARDSTSVVVAPSTIPGCGSPCRPEHMGSWITSLVAAGKVPGPKAGEVPIYEVLIDHAITHDTVLSQGPGGSNGAGIVSGKKSGLFMVGTRTDLFWPGRTPFADETIATEHELAENVNLLLNRPYGGLIGDGACEFPTCHPDLAEGVGPTSFETGDGCGRAVKGWLVQPLATASDGWSGLEPTTCSFHLKNASAPPPPPPPPPSSGCAADAGMFLAGADGALLWYGNDDPGNGSAGWAVPEAEQIGSAWASADFRQVIGGGDGVIYVITEEGALLWYRYTDPFGGHGSFATGSGKQIGHGWASFATVVGGGDGVLYAMSPDGDLRWYRHADPSGGAASFAAGSGAVIGTGWNNLASIVAGGQGVLYATTASGDLLWYRHTDPTGGSKSWATGSGGKIGSGFDFDLRSAGGGVLYGFHPNGDVDWYRHADPVGGSPGFANQGKGLLVGHGFAALDAVRIVDVAACP